ncbi:ATP-binding protein [Paenibacillus sp. Soil522]|uniref:ATP-binding protein n=1 Tax=Paenibacillus sp. Soil522 TaxID=1736388 RepID=UPI001F235332|nr:ATP-binding protein [Paenibacillus sp. Soil522]
MIAGGIISINSEVHKEVENYFTYTINEVVRFEEDYCYEFKEIKGNPKNSVKNTISEYASSFLNGRGGRVLYGITNEKVVKGVVATSKDKDEIKIVIYDRLFLINPAISPDHFEINYHPVYDRDRKIIDDLYIIEVITPISPDKSAIYFVNGNELHVRLDGVKKKLIGTEIVSFIRKKINLE